MSNIVAFRPASKPRSVALLNTPYEPAQIVNIAWPAEPTTEVGRNALLRRNRREAWHAGMTRVNYYRAALDMEHAIHCAQRWGAPEGRNHPKYDLNSDARSEILRRYRAALGDQILRPAPRLAEVEWKRRKIKEPSFKYCGLPMEAALQAIEDDLAFLAAHPVRKAKCG